MVAGQQGKAAAAREAKIHAQVHIGKPKELPGFAIAVELKVEGVEDQALVDAAHEASALLQMTVHTVCSLQIFRHALIAAL